MQILSHLSYFLKSLFCSILFFKKYDIVLTTSSKFGTAFLGFIISKIFKKKHAVDIRDVFSDNLTSLSFSNNFIIKNIIKIIYYLEKKIINHANWINIVSPGFLNYDHLKFHKNKIKVYTNGIDDIFIQNRRNLKKNIKNKIFCITYAGNIGYGQALEKTIIPIALHFKSKIIFNIIGDGNSIKLLENKLKKNKLKNVNLLKPVSRTELIKYYNYSDILFLQLNNIKAFKNVLPSKIFEYGSFDKPILAGVSGVAEKFLRTNLPNSYIFHPDKSKDAINKINEIMNNREKVVSNSNFVSEFNRKKIMDEMITDIYNNIKL